MYVIDNETAEAEFQRFCEAWEIDVDEASMKDEEKIDFQSLKGKIISSIRRGRLCVNEDETLSYTISEKTTNQNKTGQTLTIKRPNGATYLTLDKYKEGQGIHKFNGILGAMTNHAPEYFADFDGVDLKPLQAVVSIFLA